VKLIGVIHLPPLPGSPRAGKNAMRAAVERAAGDAKALAQAGFEAIVIENFGDAPFFKDAVPAITIAAMTTCALETREAAPSLPLGINVLRNDALAALAVAAASGASFVRVNVLSGARVTDQGIVEGRAAEVLRARAAIAKDVRIFADVDVKHSAPLAVREIEDEVHELADRALADAILVTGAATGSAADEIDLERVRAVTRLPVFVASGATERTVKSLLAKCDGVIVGTAIKRGRRAGGPVDPKLAKAFVRAVTIGAQRRSS
jgi:membrane complex biogenesis BtpA family protein